MALTFAPGSTNKVVHGSAASLDDLPGTALTAWAWVYRTGTGPDQTVMAKGTGSTGWLWRLDGSTSPAGANSILIQRATLDGFRLTNDATGAVAANTWTFVAFTANPGTRVYKGTLTAAVAEVTSFAVPGSEDGSGAYASDAASDLWVGNWEPAPTIAFEGRIERVGLIARVLTQAELEAIRLAVIKDCNVANTALLTDYRNGSAIDYSGNGNNGTITGATNSDGPWTSALAALQAPQRHLNQLLGR